MTKDEFMRQLNAGGAYSPEHQQFLNALEQIQPSQQQQSFAAPARPQPADVLIDLSNPRGEGMPKQFAKGAAIALRRAGRGLKGLFGDLSPEDIAELDRMKAYEEQAGMPATLGDVAMQMPMYLGGPASMLGRAAQAGLVGGLTSPENRMEQAGYAAGGSLLGEALLGSTAKALRGPVAQEYVAGLYEKGIRPTLAQALGGGWKEAEEKMTSMPIIGSAVQRAQKRALESFNTASIKDVINELNTGLLESGEGKNLLTGGANVLSQQFTDIGKIEPGAKGLEKAYNAVSKVYNDLAANTEGAITPQLSEKLTAAKDRMHNISEEAGRSFDSLFEHYIGGRIDPNGTIPGGTMKEIDSDLTSLISELKGGGSVDKNMASAFESIQNSFDSMMDEMNPGYQSIKRNADAAYRKLALLGKASTSSVGSELATPANLAQQLRAEDVSKWKKNFAMNKSDWADWARQNIDLMGNKFPESGTAARSAMADLVTGGIATHFGALPQALAAYGTARAAWSPAVQDYLVRQAIAQPGPMRSGLVSLADLARRPAAAGGAIIGQRTGR